MHEDRIEPFIPRQITKQVTHNPDQKIAAGVFTQADLIEDLLYIAKQSGSLTFYSGVVRSLDLKRIFEKELQIWAELRG